MPAGPTALRGRPGVLSQPRRGSPRPVCPRPMPPSEAAGPRAALQAPQPSAYSHNQGRMCPFQISPPSALKWGHGKRVTWTLGGTECSRGPGGGPAGDGSFAHSFPPSPRPGGRPRLLCPRPPTVPLETPQAAEWREGPRDRTRVPCQQGSHLASLRRPLPPAPPRQVPSPLCPAPCPRALPRGVVTQPTAPSAKGTRRSPLLIRWVSVSPGLHFLHVLDLLEEIVYRHWY